MIIPYWHETYDIIDITFTLPRQNHQYKQTTTQKKKRNGAEGGKEVVYMNYFFVLMIHAQ